MPALPSASPPPAVRPAAWRRRASGLAGILVVLLAVVGSIAEPFWLRPLMQHYVRTHANRDLTFDGAQIRLDAQLRPVLRLRNLKIENASWAAARPLMTAAEVDLTFAWRSLVDRSGDLPLAVIVDGDIDLEQQADGLRNWRLADPQDRGPGKVRVLELRATNSRLRLVQHGRGSVLELATRPLAQEERLASRPDSAPMTQTLTVSGSQRGAAYAGEFSVGPTFSLADSGVPMPLRGQLRFGGGASLAVEGVAHDLLQLAGFDLDAHLLARDLNGTAGPLFATDALPALPADGRARVKKEGPHWIIADLQARIGSSDVAGRLDIDRPPPSGRLLLRGTLVSQRLQVDELRRARGGQAAAGTVTSASAPPGRSPPRDNGGPDAELDLQAGRILGLAADPRWSTVDDLRTHVALRAGQLTLAPFAFGLVGGTASGRLTVDTRARPLQAALDLAVDGLHLDRLVAPRSSAAGIQGRLVLQTKLRFTGSSAADWQDSVAGRLSAHLDRASLPASLAARMALDGGQWLRSLVSPGAQVPVTCSTVDMQFTAGRGRTSRLAIETADLLLTGSASVDLRNQSFDLVLTPLRKQAALLALDKSVQLKGGFKHPKITLVDKAEGAAQTGCRNAVTR